MLSQGKGCIINIASTASFSAAGGGSAYTAAKHALLGLTRQLCFEYGKQGIRVNAICPGATATPLAIPEDKTDTSPDMEAAVSMGPCAALVPTARNSQDDGLPRQRGCGLRAW